MADGKGRLRVRVGVRVRIQAGIRVRVGVRCLRPYSLKSSLSPVFILYVSILNPPTVKPVLNLF